MSVKELSASVSLWIYQSDGTHLIRVCVSRVAAITSVQIYERADRRVVLDFSPEQSATITLADN